MAVLIEANSIFLRAARFLAILGLVFVGVAKPAFALEEPGRILPTDGDASANWKMAGMLSVGGIPNRTTVCATLTTGSRPTRILNSIS